MKRKTEAARRLGAYTVAIQGMAQYSSVVKGESLQDTIRSIYQTTGADLIVLRHPDDDSSQMAASVSYVPVINGGSGTEEHPTQALLDLYTIRQFIGRLKNLKVVLVGDLLYGRTTKSLAKLLALVDSNTQVIFVSPRELKAPRDFVNSLRKKLKVTESTELMPHLKTADVVYMTRVQKEWFEKAGKLGEYEKVKNAFRRDFK